MQIRIQAPPTMSNPFSVGYWFTQRIGNARKHSTRVLLPGEGDGTQAYFFQVFINKISGGPIWSPLYVLPRHHPKKMPTIVIKLPALWGSPFPPPYGGLVPGTQYYPWYVTIPWEPMDNGGPIVPYNVPGFKLAFLWNFLPAKVPVF